jgi:predicted metal-dependent peptidase
MQYVVLKPVVKLLKQNATSSLSVIFPDGSGDHSSQIGVSFSMLLSSGII